MRNKTKIFIGIIAILILAAAGFIFFRKYQAKNNTASNKDQSAQQAPDNNLVKQLEVAAVNQNDKEVDGFQACSSTGYDARLSSGSIDNAEPADMVQLIGRALIADNPTVCGTLAEPNKQQDCLDTYYTYKSLTGDFCANVKGAGFAGFCAAVRDGKPDSCQGEGASKIVCQATASQNDSLCNAISDSLEVQSCKNNVLVKKAVAAKNPDLCNSINRDIDLNDNLGYFACRVLSSAAPDKNALLDELNNFYKEKSCGQGLVLSLAKDKNDPSICERIPFKQMDNQKLYQDCKAQFK